MCGICGELHFGPPNEAGVFYFDRLIDLMARRGPDARGSWFDGQACRLGFRRLSILDLSPAADQPMVTDGENYALVFNGEIYNFRELRAELEQRGVAFQTSGDTEVVLQALIHWGKAALDRFNGMFALAFYDRRERWLLLARDHAGIKPLYYLLNDQGLFFASQYDQILAHPWRDGLPVSPDGLGLYLRLGYIPAPYAILERTYMLEPGCWLQVSGEGDIQRGRYYAFPAYTVPTLSGEEAFEAVDAAVGAAVRRQMVSDVPLGAFLSGGIDSPLVVAKMRAVSGGAVRAYTIGSDGSRFDESDSAADYARQLGVDHVLEQFTPEKSLDWLDDAVAACGEPFADFSVLPTLMGSHLARRDMTVMLSGDGGDELFWGYPERFGSVIKSAPDFRRPQWWRDVHWATHRLIGLDKHAHKNSRWPSIGDWYRQKHTWFSPSRLAGLFPALPPWPAGFALFDYDGWDADETAQWLRWNEFVGHLTMVLLKVDRAGMHNSLEIRVPLLDREVIDVAVRVDWRSCLDLSTTTGKLPLRHSLERYVNRQTKDKRGFAVPMADWLRGPLRDIYLDKVASRPEFLGLEVDRSGLKDLLTHHLSGQADNHRSLWLLLSLALWLERYYEPQGTPIARDS